MANYNLQDLSDLFKIKYGKLSENTYNSSNVLLARIKKSYDFVGKQKDMPVPLSFAGGVGSYVLPKANTGKVDTATITAKKMYAVCEIDRESIKAASQSEGAFVEMTKFSVQKTVESFMRNLSRAIFNDGSGALGTIDVGGVSGAGPWDVVISEATWKEANFEEKDFVNLSGGISSLFEITAVTPSTRTVELTLIDGAHTPVAGDVIYMQNSKDKDPSGLKGIIDATSGNLYTIPVQRRWKAGAQIAAGGAGLTTDLMNEAMLDIQRASGKVPDLIMTSYTQYRKLLNILEDQKQYCLDPRSPELVGKISFRGLEFMSAAGPVGVFVDRFIEDDRMYFFNSNFMELCHRPDFGWFDDDGSVFLRTAGDSYEARFGGYMELYCPPSFHGKIDGLAT